MDRIRSVRAERRRKRMRIWALATLLFTAGALTVFLVELRGGQEHRPNDIDLLVQHNDFLRQPLIRFISIAADGRSTFQLSVQSWHSQHTVLITAAPVSCDEIGRKSADAPPYVERHLATRSLTPFGPYATTFIAYGQPMPSKFAIENLPRNERLIFSYATMLRCYTKLFVSKQTDADREVWISRSANDLGLADGLVEMTDLDSKEMQRKITSCVADQMKGSGFSVGTSCETRYTLRPAAHLGIDASLIRRAVGLQIFGGERLSLAAALPGFKEHDFNPADGTSLAENDDTTLQWRDSDMLLAHDGWLLIVGAFLGLAASCAVALVTDLLA